MQAQYNSMKGTWDSARGGGVKVKFTVTKKQLVEGKYLNTLFASAEKGHKDEIEV